jgi:hypothetical protein
MRSALSLPGRDRSSPRLKQWETTAAQLKRARASRSVREPRHSNAGCRSDANGGRGRLVGRSSPGPLRPHPRPCNPAADARVDRSDSRSRQPAFCAWLHSCRSRSSTRVSAHRSPPLLSTDGNGCLWLPTCAAAKRPSATRSSRVSPAPSPCISLFPYAFPISTLWPTMRPGGFEPPANGLEVRRSVH